jgi:hypothetical protein
MAFPTLSEDQKALLQDAFNPWKPEPIKEGWVHIPRPLPINRDWVFVEDPGQVPLPQTRLEKVANVGEFFTRFLQALAKEGYESLPSADELVDQYEKLKRQMSEVPRVVTLDKVMTMVTEGFESLQDLPESLKETIGFLKDEVADLLDPNAVVA